MGESCAHINSALRLKLKGACVQNRDYMSARAAYELPLPSDVQRHIAELAQFAPTPNAQAMAAHLDAYPWIQDALHAFPHRNPCQLILQGASLGLGNCHKCNSCSIARLYAMRRCYEPDEEGTWAYEDGVARI